MQIKDLYNKLVSDIDQLENKQKKLTDLALKTDVTVLPRLYIRGSFYEFDEASSNIIIKTHGDTFYYPIECYDSEYLPFPGQQVLIYNTASGKRITGFEENGVQILPARRESMTLVRISHETLSWCFRLSNGQTITLPIPQNLPEDFKFQLGAMYRFRVVESAPDRFYLFEDIVIDVGHNLDLLTDIYFNNQPTN